VTIEQYSNPNPEEKPKHITDEEIVIDFTEVKDIVYWLATKGKTADLGSKQANIMRLNNLLMKHEISPAAPDRFVLMRTMHDEAMRRIKLKEDNSP
jgi:hypothetical protein